jgi:hypothetical protein
MGGRLIAFVLLLPFRLVFWPAIGLILILYLNQWGVWTREPSLWEVRRQRLYEGCIQVAQYDPDFKSEEEVVRYCMKRTIKNPIDIPY